MKIIQVVHGFPPFNIAGTEVYTYSLSKELAKKNKLFIFHRVNNLGIEEYSLFHDNVDELEIFRINNTFRLYNSFAMTYKDATISDKFGFILDQIKPDAVHIQHLMYLSTKIINEAKIRNIPIIFTLNDYWLICPQGQLLKDNISTCNAVDNLECIDCILLQLNIKKYIFAGYYFLKKLSFTFAVQLLKNIYIKYYRLNFLAKKKLIKLTEDRASYIKNICQDVDLFIAPSQFLKEKFIEFGIPRNKIRHLTYGFRSTTPVDFKNIISLKLRLGFIGNMLAAKGLHVLIEAFNGLKDHNTELKIYGKEISYKGSLGNYLKRAKRLAKNKNIKFMGGFDNGRVAEIFSDIDVLIVPSIWYENSPLVIQEAFLAKTPVIASRIGGIPELINDGVNGLLFNPGDPNDLKEKIEYIIHNPDIKEKFKENMPKVKSIEDNAKEMEEVYSSLIAQRKL